MTKSPALAGLFRQSETTQKGGFLFLFEYVKRDSNPLGKAEHNRFWSEAYPSFFVERKRRGDRVSGGWYKAMLIVKGYPPPLPLAMVPLPKFPFGKI